MTKETLIAEPQTTRDWEDRFDEETKRLKGLVGQPIKISANFLPAIKSFIHSELSLQKQSVIEMVEGMKWEPKETDSDVRFVNVRSHNQALDDLIKKLR